MLIFYTKPIYVNNKIESESRCYEVLNPTSLREQERFLTMQKKQKKNTSSKQGNNTCVIFVRVITS